jgi:NAD(P)H dehydrogenase (quinone)
MKNHILIILAHPLENSLNAAFADAYAKSAEGYGAVVKTLNLETMDFDPVLHGGYRVEQFLEPCLSEAQESIRWADHLVFVFPSWWASMPAKLKGFIDRTFLPGFAFEYESGKAFPVQKLKGKTAEILVTMDAPFWYYWLIYGNPIEKQLKRAVLQFCGFRKVTIRYFCSVKKSTDSKRSRWLKKIRQLAQSD